MRDSKVGKRFVAIILGLLTVLSLCPVLLCSASAADRTFTVDVNVYEFTGDSKYKIFSTPPTLNASAIGTLQITGDLSEGGKKNTAPAYVVASGNVSFSFSFDRSVLNTAEENWHIIEDDAKSVEDISCGDKIKNGVLILQTSLDGEHWVEDIVKTNALTSGTDFSKTINGYTTKYIQIQNGCFYRLIVAYKMERKVGENEHILGITTDVTEVKKVAEVYTFYLHDPNSKDISAAAQTPNGNLYRLGEKIKVKKDTGYSTKVSLDQDDPHFGWDLGEFYVTGYTSRIDDAADPTTPVFLKTVGDKVVLWFDLQQDIKNLNRKSNLSIGADDGGYDKQFGVKKTNFRKGALLIRYTDYQNKREEPVIYTNFLAANATTSADTKVVLFEEGDYEVSLDYMITDSKGIDTHTYYKISFKFKVRNGNDMVYPFDVETGSELQNNDVTQNGFRVDLANSKYLKLEVKRSVITLNDQGLVSLNPVTNAVSTDGKSYTSEGIYTISVRSDYTSEPTVKTIYVGTNPYMLAMVKYKYDEDQLNECLRNGYAVAEDGTVYPPEPEPEPESTPTPTGTTPSQQVSTPVEPQATQPNEESADNKTTTSTNAQPPVLPIVLAVGAVVVLILAGAVALVLVKKRKPKAAVTKEEK